MFKLTMGMGATKVANRRQSPGLSPHQQLIRESAHRSVHLVVYKTDPSLIQATIDRRAPLPKILKDFRWALRKLSPPPPYRPLDPRIFEAVDLKKRTPTLTYKQASIDVFGTPEKAETIRYWSNWSAQVGEGQE